MRRLFIHLLHLLQAGDTFLKKGNVVSCMTLLSLLLYWAYTSVLNYGWKLN